MNEKSITTITLKKINKKSVYQYIYEHRQTAKQQIVQDLTMGLGLCVKCFIGVQYPISG